ncbi:MAG TPA: shikimate kinase [Feifaniaceae bacterium]|nr:shikimate kinase [Feifaniaceae bacterium]
MGKRIYGLLGRSLKHSYSELIHRELGNADYHLIELEPEELCAFLRREDIGGLNVTIPYKRDVIPFCDALDQTARVVGSVNTIVRSRDGRLVGYNTDVYGLTCMAQRAGISFAGRKVVVFGSGGASLTAQYAAKQGGAREVVVVSRSGPDTYETLSRHADAELLVNATPVGMYPNNGALPADPAGFPACKGVLEFVYNPLRTALTLRAQSLGIPVSDALIMLTAQAKAAEELFWDQTLPESEITRIVLLLKQQTQNIVLVGMPGSGKSSVGAALGRLSGRETVDFDREIELAAGKPIPRIFAESGEEAFRELERQTARQWGAEHGRILITGGGIVKDERNYVSLKQNGRIYQVEREVARLERAGRPLSEHADLAAMQRERQPLYERFRDASAQNGASAEQAAREIWEEYNENFSR